MSIRGSQQARSAARAARRRWLMQAGALTYSATLPLWVPRAAAQSQSTLNALPRIALIIGNTKYLEAPLKNPGNDAKAIAAELQKVGFKVNLQLDTGRAQLADAIQAYGADLAKTKGVGLFYYAGHGAQLGWRNYLIPVDADVEKLEDMKTKTVELNTLLAGLTKAQNPMNVIILDACRDNPFGSKVPTEHKGLSQFDAPPGSLLAYATSPGNTAGDGEGANGLYTENLLREIKVPEAKIEDVLKRVRLNVRRKSEGQQIPWESTSLEEDFYFLPPKNITKKSQEELDRQFNLEKSEWDNIKESKNVDDFYAFLSKYPRGFITEQTAFAIEQLQKAKIAPQADKNGITQKFNEERYRVGDSWVMKATNNITGAHIYNSKTTVNKIENGLVYSINAKNESSSITTLDGGFVRAGSPEGWYLFDPPRVDLPGDILSVGKTWIGRCIETFEKTGKSNIREDVAKVVAYEEIELAIGKVWAYKIIMNSVYSNGTKRVATYWVEPGWGVFLKLIREIYRAKTTINETYEMISRVRGKATT